MGLSGKSCRRSPGESGEDRRPAVGGVENLTHGAGVRCVTLERAVLQLHPRPTGGNRYELDLYLTRAGEMPVIMRFSVGEPGSAPHAP